MVASALYLEILSSLFLGVHELQQHLGEHLPFLLQNLQLKLNLRIKRVNHSFKMSQDLIPEK
jgi:hypothetical protein